MEKQKYYLGIAVSVGVIAIAACGILISQEEHQFFKKTATSLFSQEQNEKIQEGNNEDVLSEEDLSFRDQLNLFRNMVSEWNSCKNNESGFTVKYPEDWIVFSGNKDSFQTTNCRDNDLVFFPSHAVGGDVWMQVSYIGNEMSMEQYVAENTNIFTEKPILKVNYSAFDDEQNTLQATVETGDHPARYLYRDKEIFFLQGSNLPKYYFNAFTYGMKLPYMHADENIESWKECENSSLNYKVKYPSRWHVQVGDVIRGIQVFESCDQVSHFNDITFTLANQQELSPYSRYRRTGINLRVEEGVEQESTFENFLREDEIDGEKLIWTNENLGIFYHNSKKFEIIIYNDVSPEILKNFLSTFTFLD